MTSYNTFPPDAEHRPILSGTTVFHLLSPGETPPRHTRPEIAEAQSAGVGKPLGR